jgi:hypothetical protein
MKKETKTKPVSRNKLIIKNLKEQIISLETQNYLMHRTLESIQLKTEHALKHKFGRGLQ